MLLALLDMGHISWVFLFLALALFNVWQYRRIPNGRPTLFCILSFFSGNYCHIRKIYRRPVILFANRAPFSSCNRCLFGAVALVASISPLILYSRLGLLLIFMNGPDRHI